MKASELRPVFHSHQPSICARRPSRSSKSLQVICKKFLYGVIGKPQSNGPFHLQEVKKLERWLTSVILPTTRSPTSGLYLSGVWYTGERVESNGIPTIWCTLRHPFRGRNEHIFVLFITVVDTKSRSSWMNARWNTDNQKRRKEWWYMNGSTNLVLRGLTVTSLLTLSTVPATDAITSSFSTYVPWPLQDAQKQSRHSSEFTKSNSTGSLE